MRIWGTHNVQMHHLIVLYGLIAAVMQLRWSWFCYDREQFGTQLWRLWTGHWVHLGWTHYALNVIALLCLPLVLPYSRVKQVLLLLLLLPPLMSVLLYYWHPALTYYAGLSGVLHGLYVAMALLQLFRAQERGIALILLGLIVGKIAYEQWQGDSQTAALIGYPVIIDAHLYGALLGMLWALGDLMLANWRYKYQHQSD